MPKLGQQLTNGRPGRPGHDVVQLMDQRVSVKYVVKGVVQDQVETAGDGVGDIQLRICSRNRDWRGRPQNKKEKRCSVAGLMEERHVLSRQLLALKPRRPDSLGFNQNEESRAGDGGIRLDVTLGAGKAPVPWEDRNLCALKVSGDDLAGFSGARGASEYAREECATRQETQCEQHLGPENILPTATSIAITPGISLPRNLFEQSPDD